MNFIIKQLKIEDSAYGKCYYAQVECGDLSVSLSRFPVEDTWLCDSIFGLKNMYPFFCHGIGSRSCAKKVVRPELNQALEEKRKKLNLEIK